MTFAAYMATGARVTALEPSERTPLRSLGASLVGLLREARRPVPVRELYDRLHARHAPQTLDAVLEALAGAGKVRRGVAPDTWEVA